jgi:hypothetical protein
LILLSTWVWLIWNSFSLGLFSALICLILFIILSLCPRGTPMVSRYSSFSSSIVSSSSKPFSTKVLTYFDSLTLFRNSTTSVYSSPATSSGASFGLRFADDCDVGGFLDDCDEDGFERLYIRHIIWGRNRLRIREKKFKSVPFLQLSEFYFLYH